MLRLARDLHPFYAEYLGDAPAGGSPKAGSEGPDTKPNKCLTSLRERDPKGSRWEWVSLLGHLGPLSGLSSKETRRLIPVSVGGRSGGRPFSSKLASDDVGRETMAIERNDLIEVIRLTVRALDEVVRDLESLGRTPAEVKRAVSELRDIEYRLLSEPETSASIVI